jgi:hypothetical protein
MSKTMRRTVKMRVLMMRAVKVRRRKRALRIACWRVKAIAK